MQPKSTAQHIHEGTYRADRHDGRLDANVRPSKPEMPDNMPEAAAKLWEIIVRNLPSAALSEMDAAALEMCCLWFARWKAYEEKLQAVSVVDDYKVLMKAAMAAKQFALLAGRFGLTPADRMKLRSVTLVSDEPDALDLLSKYFS